MSQRDVPDWFSFYVYEFMSDERVVAMTLEQVGAYVLLLLGQWINGSIPADIPALARILKRTPEEMEILWAGIAPCFKPHPEEAGRLIQPRLEQERSETLSRIEKKREQMRVKRERSKSVPEQCGNVPAQNGNVPPPCTVLSLNTETTTKKKEWDTESAFRELWGAYPAKGRVQINLAKQYYIEEIRTPEAHAAALASVTTGKWAKSEKWAKGFVLALPAWLHNRAWETEDPEPAETAPAPSIASTMDPEIRRRLDERKIRRRLDERERANG